MGNFLHLSPCDQQFSEKRKNSIIYVVFRRQQAQKSNGTIVKTTSNKEKGLFSESFILYIFLVTFSSFSWSSVSTDDQNFRCSSGDIVLWCTHRFFTFFCSSMSYTEIAVNIWGNKTNRTTKWIQAYEEEMSQSKSHSAKGLRERIQNLSLQTRVKSVSRKISLKLRRGTWTVLLRYIKRNPQD